MVNIKKLIFKTIVISVFYLPVQLFSQIQNEIISVDTSWDGYPMCSGGHGMCYMNSSNNKSLSNTKISFNKERNELTLVISKKEIDTTSKLKITQNELEKGFYLYNFDENFDLPNEILNQLNIKNRSKIKQGNYLVKEIEGNLIIKVKLE